MPQHNTRKSPRNHRSASKLGKPASADIVHDNDDGYISLSASTQDGRSSSTAFVVSPTVVAASVEEQGTTFGDGKSVSSAIPISPTVPHAQDSVGG